MTRWISASFLGLVLAPLAQAQPFDDLQQPNPLGLLRDFALPIPSPQARLAAQNAAEVVLKTSLNEREQELFILLIQNTKPPLYETDQRVGTYPNSIYHRWKLDLDFRPDGNVVLRSVSLTVADEKNDWAIRFWILPDGLIQLPAAWIVKNQVTPLGDQIPKEVKEAVNGAIVFWLTRL